MDVDFMKAVKEEIEPYAWLVADMAEQISENYGLQDAEAIEVVKTGILMRLMTNSVVIDKDIGD